MGSLTYDGALIEFDDRLLAHLHVAITHQLRKGNSFAMSWRDSMQVGYGRSSIWLHPNCMLHFKFNGSKLPELNPEWIRRLIDSAESSTGLVVTQEDGALGFASAHIRI